MLEYSSRPSDKEGVRSSRPRDRGRGRGGGLEKTFFHPLWASVWAKNKGRGGGGAGPWPGLATDLVD